MSAVYPLGIAACLLGEIDMLGDTIKATLVGTGFTYNPNHDSKADITGEIHTPTVVNVDSVGGGIVLCDPITFAGVNAGPNITGIVVYRDSGAEATSQLLCHVNRRAGGIPMTVVPNNGDLIFTFDFLFKL